MDDNVGDAAVRRAIQRRHELKEEMRQIDLFLSLYERFAGQPVAVQNFPGSEPRESGESEMGALDDIAVGGGMTQKDFVDLARELLLEIGRPVNGPGLLRKFHERGRRIGGADEMKNLTTKVWRAKNVIIKIPGAGYWPVDVPCPAVSYMPPPKDAEKEGDEK